jgi:hypothetical protein
MEKLAPMMPNSGKKRGRPRSHRVRVVLKISPKANKLLTQIAKQAGMPKGQFIEHWLENLVIEIRDDGNKPVGNNDP